jgi:hypothetical protein
MLSIPRSQASRAILKTHGIAGPSEETPSRRRLPARALAPLTKFLPIAPGCLWRRLQEFFA